MASLPDNNRIFSFSNAPPGAGDDRESAISDSDTLPTHRNRRFSQGWPFSGQEAYLKRPRRREPGLAAVLCRKCLDFSSLILRKKPVPSRTRLFRPKSPVGPSSRSRPRSGEFHNRSRSEIVRRPSFVEVSKRAHPNEGLTSRPPVPAFQETAPSIRSAPDAVTRLWDDSRAGIIQSTMVGEELGRLYLWSQGFDDSDLEIILCQSKELEDTVLESLSSIGETLIKMLPSSSDPFIVDPQLRVSAQELDDLVKRGKDLTRESYDSNDDDAYVSSGDESLLSVSESEQDAGKDFLDQLKSDVNRLLTLAPSMERTLRASRSNLYADEGGLMRKRAKVDVPPTPSRKSTTERRRDSHPGELHASENDKPSGYSEDFVEEPLGPDDFGLSDRYIAPRITRSRTLPLSETYQLEERQEEQEYRLPQVTALEFTAIPFLSEVPSLAPPSNFQSHEGCAKRKREVQKTESPLPEVSVEALLEEIGGPCIRCSEKRKLCDPDKTCAQCRLAGVRCVRKAEEFSLLQWPENHPSRRSNRQTALEEAKLASLQTIWNHLGSLPSFASLAADSGKRIILQVSFGPEASETFDNDAPIDVLPKDDPEIRVIDALDILCEDLSTKLSLVDGDLPADVTTNFLKLVPDLRASAPLSDMEHWKNLEELGLLDQIHSMTSILALLKCLPHSTIHTKSNEFGLARTVLSFAYSCFVNQLLDSSDKLSETIRNGMSHSRGHNAEIRYAIGLYYSCIKELPNLDVGLRADEILSPLMPRIPEVLSILSSLFEETRETLKERKRRNLRDLRRFPETDQELLSFSIESQFSGMLDVDLDLEGFLIKHVPEVPLLPPFHLVCCLSENDHAASTSLAAEKPTLFDGLEPIPVRRLLNEVNEGPQNLLKLPSFSEPETTSSGGPPSAERMDRDTKTTASEKSEYATPQYEPRTTEMSKLRAEPPRQIEYDMFEQPSVDESTTVENPEVRVETPREMEYHIPKQQTQPARNDTVVEPVTHETAECVMPDEMTVETDLLAQPASNEQYKAQVAILHTPAEEIARRLESTTQTSEIALSDNPATAEETEQRKEPLRKTAEVAMNDDPTNIHTEQIKESFETTMLDSPPTTTSESHENLPELTVSDKSNH